MGELYWLWVGGRLLLGVVIIGWAMSYLGTGSAEEEFRKTLDAMKQVHSFRVALTASPGTEHNEMFWEVDCNRDTLYCHRHFVDTGNDPPVDMTEDQTTVAGHQYDRQSDGSWREPRYPIRGGAKGYCRNLAEGTDSNLLPKIASMIKRSILEKGDPKTVNGVRCRQWLVAMKGAPQGLEHDTVCLGLEDHLPYEMTVDWEHSRSVFSDYNTSIQIDVPEAAFLPASTASN